MQPSRLALWAFALPALLSVATIYRPEFVLPIMGLDGLFVLAALLDWRLSRRDTVFVEVQHREILSIGQPNQVHVQLTTRSRPRLSLSLRLDLPPSFHALLLPINIDLERGVTTETSYHVTPTRRGEYHLGDHHVRFTSRLGLWTVQKRLATQRRVRVYPDLALIRTYEMLARQHRQYALVRASALRGGESEFARLRDYTTDDDARFVDWKATARRNRLTTREYQLESDQNVFLIIDSGRLMTAEVDGMTQFDHALNTALLMAHVASRGGDRVGAMCFDEEVRAFVLPEGGPRSTGRIVQATYALHPKLTESSFDGALSSFEMRMKQRSLLVIFTQLVDDTAVDELSAHLRHLSRRHLPLVVILEDTDLNALAAATEDGIDTATDLYRKGAAAELLHWKSQATTRLKKTGALVLESPARDLSNRVINRYLELKTRHAI